MKFKTGYIKGHVLNTFLFDSFPFSFFRIKIKFARVKLPVLAGLILLSHVGFSQNIYVSPDGNDSWRGSKGHPYATLERALQDIANSKKDRQKRRATINLRGGVYTIHHTIHIDSNLSDIVIQAYKKEKVTFSGGINIPVTDIHSSDLKNHDAHKKIYEVNLQKAGITDYGEIHNVGFARPYLPAWGEIFVNGRPLHLARWPNKGMIPMGKVLDKGSVPRNNDFTDKGGVIKYDSARINRWAKEKDAWMAGYFRYGYADDMVRIRNIDTVAKTITTASPAMYGYGSGKPWTRWYGVNILSELDDTGEYYIDRQKGMLYFIPATNEIRSLSFSLLEDPFILLEKTKHVIIKGITFACARGMGIAMDNTRGVTIEGCIFKNLGSLGITIGKGIKPFKQYRHQGTGMAEAGIVGSLWEHLYDNTTFNREGGENNSITGCEFYQLGAGGVILGGGNRLTLQAGNNIVENCLFHDINRIEKSYRPAVYITGVGNKVLHCEMYDLPSMAILMHGNNHLIAYNYIHDVCLKVEDQGAFYFGRDPSERGTVIRYNYFANIPDHFSTSAVYEDDGACGLTVIGNIFYQAGKMDVLIGGGSDNVYKNNIFIENKTGIHVDNRLQNWDKDALAAGGIYEKRLKAVAYRKPPYSMQYPRLKNYFNHAAVPKNNLFENNVFVRVKQLIHGDKAWLDFKASNWVTEEDPEFVSLKDHNFSLKPQSLVYKKLPGFREIPFDKIGLYKGRRP